MEQLTLGQTAQALMDMYYKDFATDEDFFGFDFFLLLSRAVYSKMLNQEAKEWRRVARQDSGFWNIDVSPEWLTKEEVPIKFREGMNVWIGQLKDMPFAFDFDKWSSGISDVFSPEIDKLERTTHQKVKELRHMPKSQVKFWYPAVNMIYIVAEKGDLKEHSIEVSYVPALVGDECEKTILPPTKQADVLSLGFQVMMNIKNGVVDMTNNSNPNAVMATEIDNVFANTRTKA